MLVKRDEINYGVENVGRKGKSNSLPCKVFSLKFETEV